MKKNVHAFVLFVIFIGMSIVTFSQKKCDLSIAYDSPLNSVDYAYGETININIKVSNNGPEDIIATDTFAFRTHTDPIPTVIFGDTILAGTSKVYPFAYYENGNNTTTPEVISDCVYFMSIGNTITFSDTLSINDTNCITYRLLPNPVGINKISNPVSHNLTLKGTTLLHTKRIAIHNLFGRRLYEKEVSAKNDSWNFDTSVLDNGYYIINLVRENGVTKIPFTVLH
jgi:hypothetical protein